MDADGKVTACGDFCDRVYLACTDARWQGKRLGDLFADGKAFCEAQGFNVPAEDSNSLVSKAARQLQANSAMGLALVLGALLFSGTSIPNLRSVSFSTSASCFLVLAATAAAAGTDTLGINRSCPFYNLRAPTPQRLRFCTW